MKPGKLAYHWSIDDTGLTLAIWPLFGLWIGLRRFWVTDRTWRTGVSLWIFKRKVYERTQINEIQP